MPGLDMAQVSTVLKRVQEGVPVEQMMSEANYSKSRKRSGKGFGAGLFNTTQTARNQSIGIRNSGAVGSTNDNEDMPRISAPSYANPQYDAVRDYLRLYISGKAASRALSNDEKQAYTKDVAGQVYDLQTAYWRDYDFRGLNSSTTNGSKTGCRGILNNATYNASPSTAITFTLDITTNTTGRGLKMCQGLEPNMAIEVYNSTGWTVAALIIVASVDPVNSTFTGTLSDTLAGTSDAWYLFREGDFNRDLSGLGDIIDDGTLTTSYAGLTSSGLWTGHVLGNSGTLRSFAPTFMNQAMLLARKENGDRPVQAWMSYGMYNELLGYVQRVTQLNKEQGNTPFKANIGGDLELWGKNTELQYSSKARAHEILLIQSDKIDYYEQEPLAPISFGKQGGRDVLFQRIPGKDNWEAVYVHEATQRSLRRNLNVKVTDLDQLTF